MKKIKYLYFFIILLVVVVMLNKRVMINDITTSIEPVPQFVKIAEMNPTKNYEYGGPANFKVQQQKYPEVKPLQSSLSTQEMFIKVKEHSSAMPNWKIVSVDEPGLRIEAVAQTKWLKFKDDIVFEIRATEAGSVLQMRSKSRVGRDDFGANAKRISKFIADVSQ